MAVINYTTSYGPGMHYVIVTWTAMAGGDTGDPISLPEWADKTVQYEAGTIGTSTIDFEGSNDKVTWFDLSGADSVSIGAKTADFLSEVLENPVWVRPVVNAGTGTGITVKLVATQKRAR